MLKSKLNPRWIAVPVLLATLLTSCTDGPLGDGHDCTANAVAGINVTVPGGNGLLRLGKTISGTITEGTYSENLYISSDPSVQQPDAQLFGAFERTGTYSLLVRVTGYQDYRTNNLKVTRDKGGCHVDALKVTATLTAIVAAVAE